ncbi:hypothetical protein LVJ94_06270 [Pendulispora rubella]|uniref:Uncharacterized protein n=1 Tax=Pendulispora rubella TaxID=2741070 RepID=A0ABZ2LA95_9BACT
MSKQLDHPRGSAIVIGASMAGLCAARALANHFQNVTVFERDALPNSPTDRRGVPQGRHFHGLLIAGQRRLETWFPGFTKDLIAGGAVPISLTRDGHFYMNGGTRVRFDSDLKMPACSRSLLEHHVRERVRDLRRVTFRAETTIADLTSTDDGRRITGVRLGNGVTYRADLVVDASGRGARSLRWLAPLGYEPPPTDNVTIDVGYATRVIRPPEGEMRDWRFAMVSADPPTRLCALYPMERGRWVVTLAGYHGDHPPTDDAGYLAFAKSLPSPVVADLLTRSEPLGPVVGYRFLSSQLRHFERAARLPHGLIVLGDGICSLNPVYGQGMTSAALQSEALDATLERTPGLDAQLARAFYRRAAKSVVPLWQMATGGDLTLPGTAGPTPFLVAAARRMANWYMQRLMRAGSVSATVSQRMLEVLHLVSPPSALLSPGMIYRALGGQP